MELSLVTGANGHVGNNLVRELIKDDQKVRAGIRNLDNRNTLEGLDCDVVYCDFLNTASLKTALKDVDVLYHVAAVYKHWAENEEEEIIKPNTTGTINILKAAKEAGVKKIIYVSSIVALEYTLVNSRNVIRNDTWNTSSQNNPYVRSKTESEKMAWKLKEELDLDMVSILPSTIVGGEFKKETETLNILKGILYNKLPFRFDATFNYIDVQDVAKAMISAAKKGISGSRYVVANQTALSLTETFEIAQTVNPEVVIPDFINKETLFGIADKLELEAKKTNTRPQLVKSNLERFHGINNIFDISNTEKDLDFSPKSCRQTLKETFMDLYK